MNKKVNHVHERALRLVYQDYSSTFEELLKKDNSMTFHHKNIHQVAIEMFKVKHNLSPPFMKEISSAEPTWRTNYEILTLLVISDQISVIGDRLLENWCSRSYW